MACLTCGKTPCQCDIVRTWGSSETLWVGDPPTDRGPIIGIPQMDLDAMRAEIQRLRRVERLFHEMCAESGAAT